jgi:ribonuclease HII
VKPKNKIDPRYEFELLENYDSVIGIDEVGRGCLAGPLVVASFVLRKGDVLLQVNDSKVLSSKKREELNIELIKFDHGISEISVEDIDTLGLSKALLKGYIESIDKLKISGKCIVLLDGNVKYDLGLESISIVDGDAKCFSIASASIIAKVYRDKLMRDLSTKYPLYHFEKNVGYGTKDHLKALKDFGICEIHRKSFKPISTYLGT